MFLLFTGGIVARKAELLETGQVVCVATPSHIHPSEVLGVGQAPLKLSGDWTLAQCCHMCFFSVLKASIRHHMWYQGLLLMQHPSWELLEPQPEVPLGFISIFFFPGETSNMQGLGHSCHWGA